MDLCGSETSQTMLKRDDFYVCDLGWPGMYLLKDSPFAN